MREAPTDLLAPDAGMAQIAARMQQEAATGPGQVPHGPGLDLEAGISLQLGRVATALEKQQHTDLYRRARLRNNIFPFDINPGLITGSGTFDQPMVLGPREGFAWDVELLVAASFTAGTVTVYKQGIADHNIRGVFPSAGTLRYSGASLFLRAPERLLIVGTGITGNVTISGSAIMVAEEFVGEYLL
jgi:hypothetical protein